MNKGLQSFGSFYEMNQRDNNEDSALICKLQTAAGEVLIAVVADGLGGMDRGEIASGYTIESISKWFYTDLIELLKRRKSSKIISKSLYRLIYKIHNDLKQYGIENEITLGTTLSIFLYIAGRVIIFNQGDSQIIKFTNRTIKEITPKDKKGENELTRCIGIGSIKEPFMKIIRIRNRNSFLICSDGFYKKLDLPRLQKATGKTMVKLTELKEEPDIELNKCLKTFGKRNTSLGETDNMTAIFLQY